MRKRLRKKRHLGEFQELGFEVTFRLREGATIEDLDPILDAFLEEAMEANGLVAGGGGRPDDQDFFVCLGGRGSATDDHRRRVVTWLGSRAEILDPIVGPLADAWHS
jgi:uncharacterized protein YggL (DUF469 family)